MYLFKLCIYFVCYSSLSAITPTTVFTRCVAELFEVAIRVSSEPHCWDSTIVNWGWIRCGESLLLNLCSVFVWRDWGKLCKIVGRNGDLTLAWIKIPRMWVLGWPNLPDYVCVDNKQHSEKCYANMLTEVEAYCDRAQHRLKEIVSRNSNSLINVCFCHWLWQGNTSYKDTGLNDEGRKKKKKENRHMW